jgi:hypothetical protein|tara:strand:+ start:1180 stop:1584 length:405 start_codon:yes stop_codon:yes gene_type:complete
MAKHAFYELTELIENYSKNKESFDVDKLQLMREDISLCLFRLSDSASLALANYDMSEHVRKIAMAEREQYHRDSKDDDGKRITVSEAQNLARIDCKKEAEACKEALRQKERVRIVLSSTNAIINAIASRINMVK